jgi:hypothetical protein
MKRKKLILTYLQFVRNYDWHLDSWLSLESVKLFYLISSCMVSFINYKPVILFKILSIYSRVSQNLLAKINV